MAWRIPSAALALSLAACTTLLGIDGDYATSSPDASDDGSANDSPAGDDVGTGDDGAGGDSGLDVVARDVTSDGVTLDGDAALTPGDVPGLVLWLRWDQGVVTMGGGTAVGVWRDQSGNKNDLSQSAAAAQPSFDAQTGVTFNGSTQWLVRTDTLGIGAGAARTFFLVARANATTAAGPMLSQNNGSSLDHSYTLQDNYSAPDFGIYVAGSGYTSAQATQTMTFALHTARFAPIAAQDVLLSKIVYRYDGASSPLTLGAGDTGMAKVVPSPTRTVLGTGTTMQYWSAITVKEVLVYARALDDTELAAVEQYLMAKDGI